MELSSDGINLNRIIYLDIDLNDKTDCLESLVRRVWEIARTHPAPYTLFVSGGIDSQAMLYAWKLSGVPFTAIHANYNNFNSHDVAEVEMFCEQEKIQLEVIDFNIIDFLENDLDRYARQYKCASPQLCTHMAFSEKVVGGTKLFSGNLPAPDGLSIDNTIFGLQRYATLSGQHIIPFFLQSDNAVATSAVITALGMEYRPDFNIYQVKCESYKRIRIPIIPQQNKQTGFEALKDYYDQFSERVTPQMKIAHSSLPSKRVFDQLFRNKYLIEFDNHYTPKFIVREKHVIPEEASGANSSGGT